MPDKREMEVILDKFAVETAKSLQELLQIFRDACQSDEDFSQRMWIERQPENPQIEQYFFDAVPVFYTIFEIKERKMQFKFIQGSIVS